MEEERVVKTITAKIQVRDASCLNKGGYREGDKCLDLEHTSVLQDSQQDFWIGEVWDVRETEVSSMIKNS